MRHHVRLLGATLMASFITAEAAVAGPRGAEVFNKSVESPACTQWSCKPRCTPGFTCTPDQNTRSVADQNLSFGIEVQLKKQGGTFVVPVQINGAITLDFMVDSGASDVSVPADVFSTLTRTGTIKDIDITGEQTYVLADGSKTQSVTFTIRSLKVGDRVVENVRGSVASARGEPLLGQSFLERFKSWSIDNTKHVLLLEPHHEQGPSQSVAVPINPSGLVLKQEQPPIPWPVPKQEQPQIPWPQPPAATASVPNLPPVSHRPPRVSAALPTRPSPSPRPTKLSPAEAFDGVNFAWRDYPHCGFHIVLRNKTANAARNVKFVVIFYGGDGTVIDSIEGEYRETIFGNLAKNLTSSDHFNPYEYSLPDPSCETEAHAQRAEIRVLDYQLSEQGRSKLDEYYQHRSKNAPQQYYRP
jgi:clan AA aspartic protease (TIGR02281 family)